MTHYIPAFCERNGRYQRAVCGLWILPGMHSAEPSCEDCTAYVLSEAATESLTAEDVFGPEPDKAELIRHLDFDPCGDYTPRGNR